MQLLQSPDNKPKANKPKPKEQPEVVEKTTVQEVIQQKTDKDASSDASKQDTQQKSPSTKQSIVPVSLEEVLFGTPQPKPLTTLQNNYDRSSVRQIASDHNAIVQDILDAQFVSLSDIPVRSTKSKASKNSIVQKTAIAKSKAETSTDKTAKEQSITTETGGKDIEQVTIAKTPEEDPNFQALKTQITQTAKAQQQHTSTTRSVTDAQASAPIAGNEAKGIAQEQQVTIMGAQKAGTFSATDFKEQLQARIAEMELPENEEAADNFEENNNINEVNEKALGDVNSSKDDASHSIATSTATDPNTAKVTKRVVKTLPTPKYGKKPIVTGTSKAMPAKRTASEVEQPLQEQNSSVDNQMEAHGVTDAMLASSNEGSFTNALAEKNTAKEQSNTATTQFRSQEEKDQQTVQNGAQQEAQNQVSGMHASRSTGLNKVAGNQKGTADKNSLKRKEIADKIDTIYNTTKGKVDTLLSGLDTKVAAKFVEGSKKARLVFEKHVADGMAAYKKDRYGDSYFSLKQFRRIKDAVVGLPASVNVIFVTGRQEYIDAMDVYITDIANLVAQKLNEAKAIIASGKTEIKTYVDSLSPELRKLGKEAASKIEDKFDSLEQSVDDKKEALINTLAEKYAEQVASVDSRIDALKAANEGLVSKVLGALQGVFDFIIKVKNTLTRLLSKIIEVVVAIITDPIGFFSNLIAGVGQGLNNFGANIMKHLQTGFIGWLTGAMQGVTITLPENVFSLKGIFSITMQVLNLGWQGIRDIGAKVIGEPIMRAIETGVEVVQIIRKDGIAGLWEHLKEQFNDLKVVVMDAMMSMIQTQVIQAGIKWILGLLSPVGAFVKAAMAIVDVVKFFIERAAQIGELVNAFIDSVAAIASGKVGAVANAIENALGKAIPVLIGLLASILGIGGLANKVVGIIRKIRKRITKAIRKFWLKVKKGAKKLLKKLGFGKKKKKGEKEDTRTSQEMRKDLKSGVSEGTKLLKNDNLDKKEIKKRLDVLEDKYNLKELKIVTDSVKDGKEKLHIHGEVNPTLNGTIEERNSEANSLAKIKLYSIKPAFTVYANNPSEFKRQIKRQEEGLNKMNVKQWLANRAEFTKNGRKKDDLSKLRKLMRKDIANAYIVNNRSLLRGLDVNVRRKKAEKYAKTILTRNHALLHNPDQVAGGEAFLGKLFKKGEITDETSLKASTLVGHSGTNSSIGSQWAKQGRIEGLEKYTKEEVKNRTNEEKENTLMNVKLKYS